MQLKLKLKESRGDYQAMAAVAASWARPVCAPRVAHKFEANSSRTDFPSPNFSAQPAKVQSSTGNASRARLGLANRGPSRRPLRRANVEKASADDADNMDDEGVVKDMERYLNELSVEYENVWDTKPVWYVYFYHESPPKFCLD